MPTTSLTPEVRSILERSTITEEMLVLPPEQLDRKLYEAVNKVIVNAGGKWNKSGKCHIFPSDPRERLGMTLSTGTSVDIKQETQAFYTPRDLAARVVQLAEVYGQTVLEPSAGEGSLALEAAAAGAEKLICIEKDEVACKRLSANLDGVNRMIHCGDFLAINPKQDPVDRVVMNPPFTRNQDIVHVRQALSWLKPGCGKLVSIMGGNVSRKQFCDLLAYIHDQGYHSLVREVEAGAFKESGTMVRTIILVVTNY